MDLSRVSIGIKTFLRDECLFNTIFDIRRTMPECRLIIADDGEMTHPKEKIYAELLEQGHIVHILHFDSGFGAKSNIIAASVQTPYLLTGSDDFDFSPSFVREGIERMQEVLDEEYSWIDIVSGRVNGNMYEFNLLIDESKVKEFRVFKADGWSANACDLTVNYSLIRSRVLNSIKWDDDVKIGGGEHAAFFLDCKQKGFRVAYIPKVKINEQKIPNSPRYRQYRARANSPERPCFVRRGITEYVLADGTVDYKA